MLLEGRTLFGRKKIFCDEPVITRDNVVSVLKEALKVHWQNRNEIDYLYQYYCGNQPILARAKKIRPEICNKIVENRANEIVTFKTGYLCGEPIQYVSRGGEQDVTDNISNLNDMMLLCGKSAHDKELAEWMYICGTGYRMVLSNKDVINTQIVPRLSIGQPIDDLDEAPFDIYTLDPRNTFVVYHSGIGERPLMGVKYVIRKDRSVVYSVYTRNNYFEIIANNEYGDPQVYWFEDRKLDEIPIIEYPLNVARLGAFEIVLSLLDAINTVQSNRLDGIEQFIQSLLVLYNCEIEDEAAKGIREAGIIKLKGVGEIKADVKVIAEQLDQQQTQTLVDYMYQTVLNIVGMPNRNGGSSTSDTGSAVIMRDGWEAAEARAKSDEMMFKESERQLLKTVLKILRSTTGIKLRLADIDIKFTRRNYENILAKAQVLTSMLANDKIDPVLAFISCGMFSDPEGAAKMSADYYAQVQAKTPNPAPTEEGGALA
jgi:SPP1 family phage portal protein